MRGGACDDSLDPVAAAVIENYRTFFRTVAREFPWGVKPDPEVASTILFDTVAVYLAFADDLLEMERLGVRVTDDGHTAIDAASKVIRCATRWRDLAAFQDLLVRRLTGPR